MTYAPPPPPGPPPPSGPPAGGPPPGYYYGQPGPMAPPPHPARGGSSAIIGIFVGCLIGVAVLVGIIVFASQPPPPAGCPVGKICLPEPPPSFAPRPSATPGGTLPPLQTPAPTPAGQTPGPSSAPATPQSNAAPYVSGTVWRSTSLGYSFEYDPEAWRVVETSDTYLHLQLKSSTFDLEVHVVGFPGSTSVDSALQSIYSQTDNFMIGRSPNTVTYDAILGPSIGYIRGKGATFDGTYKNTDGTPGDPVGMTAVGATDGQVTVVMVADVGNPNKVIGGQATANHLLRGVVDTLVNTFLWPGGS